MSDASSIPALTSLAQEMIGSYVLLLRKWNSVINLVGASTDQDIWERHVNDSVQVFHVKKNWSGVYLDIGSGGGLPGIPCAILCKANNCDVSTVLIESDARKCAFLRTVSHQLDLNVTVLNQRIEQAQPVNADIVTARALSKLETLLDFTNYHRTRDGISIFPKGESWYEEVTEAKKKYQFDLKTHDSITRPGAKILEVGRIERV